jgi:hypothetical protein
MSAQTRNDEWIEFKPRASTGRYWVGGMGIALLILFSAALVFTRDDLSWFVWIPLLILGLGVTVPLLALAWYFPTMRYLLGPHELVLSFGPIMRDRVPLNAIKSIRRRNLRLTSMSTLRFPGLALLYVDYVEFGRIRMCATAASKDVLLIDIGLRRYGITPENEVELVQEIIKRSTADIRVSENFNPKRRSDNTIS